MIIKGTCKLRNGKNKKKRKEKKKTKRKHGEKKRKKKRNAKKKTENKIVRKETKQKKKKRKEKNVKKRNEMKSTVAVGNTNEIWFNIIYLAAARRVIWRPLEGLCTNLDFIVTRIKTC